MALDPRLKSWLKALNRELDRRIPKVEELDRYYEGDHPIPDAVREVRLEAEYRKMLESSISSWPTLIVDSVEERLEVTGFAFGEDSVDTDAWEIYERNGLGADSSLIHTEALTAGRAYAIVWAGPDGKAEIIPEHPSTTIVAYETGSRRKRAAALRRWTDGSNWYATLYLPEAIYKFQAKADELHTPKDWEIREVPNESWPLPNPLGVVPVVEFAVNRSLRPSDFGTAAGEFEKVTPIIERVNQTVFAGLLSMAYQAFPIRYIIGDPIIRDPATGEARPPFQAAINRILQLENPDAKVGELSAAPLEPFIQFAEAHIRHLAAITKTPPHYLLGQIANISADGIRAAESGLVSKCYGHQRTLSEAWEETMRLALRVEDPADPRGFVVGAETKWKSPETRSQAEAADAALKLSSGGILPWQAVSEKILGATPQEIARWEAQKASDALGSILASQPTADVPSNNA